jgi:DNA modification methylase
MDAGSVQCVVTSPPYWGLRDYGVDGQLGFEPTPEEYVAKMVEVLREVWRVLRDDGTVWLNLGDSYASSPPGKKADGAAGWESSGLHGHVSETYAATLNASVSQKRNTVVGGLKAKDLVGIPWRVAFALQADGWWLRSDIIWHKPNPMPESVTDRPSKAHEYVFLLTKSPRYFYDAEAVREKDSGQDHSRNVLNEPEPSGGLLPPHKGIRTSEGRNGAGRHLRTVWTVTTEPFKGAHFATFSRKLVVPCVKAGTSAKGCCPECGAPWRRMVEKDRTVSRTVGWQPTCKCTLMQSCDEPLPPCTVLDPFAGSGTVGVVCKQLGQNFIGIELNPEYAEMARRRIANPEPEAAIPDVEGQMVFEELKP